MANETALELQNIREALIRQEDTIIFALIERAQYKHNACCYDPSEAAYKGLAGNNDSFLDFMLLETERLHARVRRYTSPDEHAFFANRLPPPTLPLIDYPAVLQPCIGDMNAEIMDVYLSRVLPSLCRDGDDEQHGSTVVADVAVLQAISKRVHYGFFVAESKFRAQASRRPLRSSALHTHARPHAPRRAHTPHSPHPPFAGGRVHGAHPELRRGRADGAAHQRGGGGTRAPPRPPQGVHHIPHPSHSHTVTTAAPRARSLGARLIRCTVRGAGVHVWAGGARGRAAAGRAGAAGEAGFRAACGPGARGRDVPRACDPAHKGNGSICTASM